MRLKNKRGSLFFNPLFVPGVTDSFDGRRENVLEDFSLPRLVRCRMELSMYIIAVIVMTIYIGLLILSRNESIEREASGIFRPFYKMAMLIYKWACIKHITLFDKAEVKKDLERLNPGISGKQLCTVYYVKKIALSLIICFTGTIVGTLICFNAYNSRMLQEDGSIKRGKYTQEPKNIKLKSSKSDENIFSIDVKAQIPENDELEKIYNEFIDALGRVMLGENDSTDRVMSDLDLVDSLENYPFYVEWESSRPEIISSFGSVSEVPETEEVVLTAVIEFEGIKFTKDFSVNVVPKVLSDKENEKILIQEMLEDSEEQSRTQDIWMPPSQYQGESIEWIEVVEDNSKLVWMFVILIAAAVFFLSDRDLHSEIERRMKKIRNEYSDIVQKFVLYMGAGMTARSAFYKISSDYESGHKANKRTHPAYEEMLYTCRELQAGVSEGAAYEHFGKRTGVKEYIRLSTLLQQNLKKGNSAILDRLKDEAYRASMEKIQNSRRLGEEASTKLLIPMVMMLLVIMVMIIIPAFSSDLL